MSKQRPNVEVLVKTLSGERGPYIPLFELIVDKSIKSAFLGRPAETAQDEIDFARQAGYDYVLYHGPLEFYPELEQEDGESHARERANGSGERVWAEEGGGVFRTISDVEQYPWPSIEELDWSRLTELEALLPPEMGIVAQYGDIFTWTWRFLGFERFSLSLVDNPALVEAVFERVAELELELFKRMAASPKVAALFYSDDIAYSTGLMVSPNVLRKYLFPWVRRFAELAAQRGIPFIYHSDGDLRPVLDELIALGVNALHPIEPHAMDILELKRKYGERLCLCGNVDVDLLARGTPQQIRERVAWLIRNVGKYGGYCLGSGNSVPEYVPLENYRAMIEAAIELGSF